jgi:EAL domain-containing protein (putative c-di-GMP-specific phosphodiesterase class I)
LQGALREGDSVARLEGDTFGVALEAVRQVDLESVLQLAARLQSALANPVSLDAARVYVSASVGFCLANRAPAPGGAALLEAAELAADNAAQNGPGAIRAFSAEMQRIRVVRSQMRDEIEHALDHAQIGPHFQPQVSTETGELTGFEALARWNHPQRGLIPPSEFIPLIERAGLSERLGDVMLFQSLSALSSWDASGLHVPTVAVNFSRDQLRNPRLPETLEWELDRFDLTPERLCVEILETVVAETENDVIVRNIAALSRLGCGIDLDDFGTGHASIAAIRRFAVRRIKIDRSFVTHIDSDPQQQRMVSAILSMAERLGLEALAEGVETAGEHTTLAQLGCAYVQGYGLARPMPLDDATAWIKAYRARLTPQPRIGRHVV